MRVENSLSNRTAAHSTGGDDGAHGIIYLSSSDDEMVVDLEMVSREPLSDEYLDQVIKYTAIPAVRRLIKRVRISRRCGFL